MQYESAVRILLTKKMSDLYTKVNQSIKLLKTVSKTIDGPIELCYSGGKDSDVILRLAQMAGINYRAIYKNTTIDPPGTIKHCRDNGVEIIQPKETFFKIIQKSGFPNRFHRFCCTYLKEYKILDNTIQGIRCAESAKRAKIYKEPVMCRIYSNKQHVNRILPILKWTNNDVKEFVISEKIECHKLYYENGKFNPAHRLGCLCCPLASKSNRIKDFMRYPRMLKLWCDNGSVWFQRMREKGTRTAIYFNDIYEVMVFSIFFDNMEKFRLSREGLFETKSCKILLEDYFKIDLL